jgi:hypothetical protein
MPAVEWTAESVLTGPEDGNGYTYGFSFRPFFDLWVTHLGVYDGGGDGLDTAHQVGLWNFNDPNEILRATVPAGGGPEDLNSHFIYTRLEDPIRLNRGSSYVVGAFLHENSRDPYTAFLKSEEVSVGFDHYLYIQPLDAAIIQGSNLSYPGQFLRDVTGYFGANLKLSLSDPKLILESGTLPNSVPEPGTMFLLGIGLIGVAGVGRRKFKKA